MTQRQCVRSVITLLGIVALAACSGESSDSSAGPHPTTPTTTSTVTSTTTTTPTSRPSGDLERRIEEAEQLAVRDHDADAAELVVVNAEEVMWPDSAFGCPLTGQTYEPGPFPGYLIELGHGDLEYTYMAAEDTELKECLFLE